MRVLEQFRQAKSGGDTNCEDRIVVGNHFVAVVDGATSKSSTEWAKETTGIVASRLVARAIEALAPASSAAGTMRALTRALETEYRSRGVLEHVKGNPGERAAASVVIFSRLRREIWMVGDCQTLIRGAYYGEVKRVDRILSQMRALYLELELLQGHSVRELSEEDTGRRFILPVLRRQPLLQNAPGPKGYAYAVVDGFPLLRGGVRIIKVPRNSEVVMASDGYPILRPTLRASEAALRALLRKDPLCCRSFQTTKGKAAGDNSFDDRAYVRLRV